MVPDKIFGLSLFLDFIDHGTHCALASSATGSLTQQQIQLLNANASLGQALIQTIRNPGDTQIENAQTGDTQTDTSHLQAPASVNQNAEIQQTAAPLPEQAASSSQDLLQQAETLLDGEQLSARERNMLATYRQHIAHIEALEQKRQEVLQKQAEIRSLSGTKFFDSYDLRNNGLMLSSVESDIANAENALRTVSGNPAFSHLLQKLEAAAHENKTSEIQTNVLDSSEKHGIMDAEGSTEGAFAQNKKPSEPVNIKLKFMKKWTQEQRQQALDKLAALSAAQTTKGTKKRDKVSAKRLYESIHGKGSVPDGYDVDHIVDIQLSGDQFNPNNLQLLDRSVNRSLGAQIMHAIKDYLPGTAFGTFTIE